MSLSAARPARSVPRQSAAWVLSAWLVALSGCGPSALVLPDDPPDAPELPLPPPGAADPPDPAEPPPIAGTLLATLDRAYQGLDVRTDPVPLGSRLSLELWSDGSAEERAGNALRIEVNPEGRARFSPRLGAKAEAYEESPLVSGKPLRLRLRRESEGAVLHLDVREGTEWTQDVARYVFGYTVTLRGRRVIALARPAGAFTITVQPEAPAGAFSFHTAYDRMSDHKLYQRRGQSADVPLHFFYRSAAAARLLVDLLSADDERPLGGYGQRSFRLEAAPLGRSAQAVLPAVPEGGNYHLRARLQSADGAQDLGEDTVRDIAVGDVFLALGQSNMSGRGELGPEIDEPPAAQVHLFGNDYQWKPGQEPMDSGDDQVDRVSEEVPGHSLLLRFAKDLHRQTGVPVGIIPAPLFGSSLDVDWRRDAERPRHRGTLYGSAIHRVASQGYGAAIRGVLWYHGEGSSGAGADGYRRLLQDLVRDLRRDLGETIFVGLCQLATLGVNQKPEEHYAYLGPQEAQRQYALSDPRSAVAALIDLPRVEEHHLSNAGIRQAGARLAAAVLARSYGLRPPLGPRLLGARFVPGRRDHIEVSYDQPLSGGAPSLYRLRDGAALLTPTALIRSGASVLLALPKEVPGGATLSYGFSSDPAAPWVKAAAGGGAALVFRDLPVQ